jgi:hypothetical protein
MKTFMRAKRCAMTAQRRFLGIIFVAIDDAQRRPLISR